METTPAQILSPDSHAKVLQSRGTSRGVEAHPEHRREPGG